MAHIEKRETATGTRYRAMVFLSQDPVTGKQKNVSKSFADEAEAKAWAATKELHRKRGTLVEPSKQTLAEYGRSWLNTIAKESVRASTWYGYSQLFKAYVEEPKLETIPRVGQKPMAQLRPEHVQELYRWLRQDHGVSRATVKALHAVVRQVLVYAFTTGAIELDLVPRLKPPRERTRKREVRAMSEAELGRFLKAARTVRRGKDGTRLPDPYYAFWYLLPATGLRPGEALALSWEDVDFESRRVTVRRSLARVPKQGWDLTDPKTTHSVRTISLPTSAVKVLQEHRERQRADHMVSGLVFTTHKGLPVDWTNLALHFHRIMRHAKLGTFGLPVEKPKGQPGPPKEPPFIPSYRPYDLRHTHATLEFARGVSPKVISKRLGHYSVAFTMDVYTAWLPEMDDDAADTMDAILAEVG